MLQTAVFAVGASLPLLLGALVGIGWRPPQKLNAAAMAFAAGALISAVAFELFEQSYQDSDAMTAGLSFAAGAAMFVAIDTVIDHWTQHSSGLGLALLAGVTLDGIPENTALGVSLASGGSIALLVAIFASNFPEAMAGAAKMRENGRSRRFVLALWGSATVLLALAVVAGSVLFASATGAQLAIPLGFAGGAVLASVVDSVAPEAFEEGGPVIALASAAGFFVAFMLGH